MAKRQIVDAHHHLWDLDHGYAYPWLQDNAVRRRHARQAHPDQRDLLPAEYLADAAELRSS